MRKAGDWTSELMKRIISQDGETPNIKHISVDGPFGTSAENIYKYEKVVLIGAGIGVTPYASLLKDIWHTMLSFESHHDAHDMTLKKVHFFWIFSTIEAFEWYYCY